MGFRFDLAINLVARCVGEPLPNPPVLWDIETDPVLAGTKLLAEAWTRPGCIRLASLLATPGRNGTAGSATTLATSSVANREPYDDLRIGLVGSPEIYGHENREPEQSVNFVTCHDGFTLNDLVSYNDKHNEANAKAS